VISLLTRYAASLCSQGMAEEGSIEFLALDDDVYALRASGEGKSRTLEADPLGRVFDLINVSSLLLAVPAEPYRSIVNALLRWGVVRRDGRLFILPEDCETRTFFHDIPVITRADPSEIAFSLSERKAAIIMEGPAIVSYGTVSPEQASVAFSSTCFSTFVKYFHDHLTYLEECLARGRQPEQERLSTFSRIAALLEASSSGAGSGERQLIQGPALDEEMLLAMIEEAGRRVVKERLVDSFFGNISARYGDSIYISETAAALDDLAGAVDRVPMNGSSSVGITASSELASHREVYRRTEAGCILHGHPRFTVVMSMYCLKECRKEGRCHSSCPERRELFGTPVVPGEIGTGPTGIINTVPEALETHESVIVHGHGIFCTGKKDFNEPFRHMVEMENMCRGAYLGRVTEVTARINYDIIESAGGDGRSHEG